MLKITKGLLVVSIMSALAGCHHELTYSYLVRHPDVLKDEANRCDEQKDASDQCKLVMRAATDFMNALNEQQQDPERFGQKIMQAEAAFVTAKQEMKAAQAEVRSLKDQKRSEEEIAAAEQKLTAAQEAYKRHKEEMQLLLGAASVNSPG